MVEVPGHGHTKLDKKRLCVDALSSTSSVSLLLLRLGLYSTFLDWFGGLMDFFSDGMKC